MDTAWNVATYEKVELEITPTSELEYTLSYKVIGQINGSTGEGSAKQQANDTSRINQQQERKSERLIIRNTGLVEGINNVVKRYDTRVSEPAGGDSTRR